MIGAGGSIDDVLRELGYSYENPVVVGEGGYGEVWRVENRALNRLETVKVLHLPLTETKRSDVESELKALGTLSNHPNIPTIYGYKILQDGRVVITLEFVEGKTLDEVVQKEGRLPMSRILDITKQVAETLEHAHEPKQTSGDIVKPRIIHNDVKPSNILVSEGDAVYVIDFGIAELREKARDDMGSAPMIRGTEMFMAPERSDGSSTGDERSDVFSLGKVMYGMVTLEDPANENLEKNLIESGSIFPIQVNVRNVKLLSEDDENDVPEDLKNIIEKAMKNNVEERYQNVGELLNDVRTYESRVRQRKISRRVALGGIVGLAASFIGLQTWKGIEKRRLVEEYRNSVEFVVDEMRKVRAENYEEMEPLFKTLMDRLGDERILRLVREGKISQGKFPYVISEGKTQWSTTDGTYWSDGFWPGMSWLMHKRTKDQRFRDIGLQWGSDMKFTDRDDATINAIRFYYSHALGYDIVQEEGLLEIALKAADSIGRRFNKNGNYIQMLTGELTEGNRQLSYIDTMTIALPLLLWAYEKTNESKYLEMAQQHCDTVRRVNVNEDGSIVQAVEFDSRTMRKIRGVRRNGFDGESCLARGQARAIKGFVDAYRVLKDKKFLDTALKAAEYFIDNLPEDNVPFYDFKDPNKDKPKDSTAASTGASGLLNVFEETSRFECKLIAYRILRSLGLGYMSDNPDYEGTLLHGCSNINRGANTDSTLIYGCYNYFDALNRT